MSTAMLLGCPQYYLLSARERMQAYTYAYLKGPPPQVLYQPLSVECDLTAMTLWECRAKGLPNVRTYTLHVHPLALFDARMLVRDFAGNIVNPLAPQINVLEDPRLLRFEWYIEGGAVAIGSIGA